MNRIISQILKTARDCFLTDKAKRVDGTSTSVDATKKNAPYGRSGQGDACEGAMRGVTAERSEISPDDLREESPKAMSIRGAERSEGIAEGEAREPSGGGCFGDMRFSTARQSPCRAMTDAKRRGRRADWRTRARLRARRDFDHQRKGRA